MITFFFILWNILLWMSIYLLVHTYLLYPIILKILSRNKTTNSLIYPKDELPQVSILMSLFNEEEIIKKKIESLLQQNYPSEKIDIYIGSDNSTDATNDIVQQYVNIKNNSILFFPFSSRQGKPGIINQLAQHSFKKNGKGNHHILIITDASVLLSPDTIYHLVKHFKNPKIGLVDAHMQHIGIQEEGISISEDQYINKEVQIKYREGIIWGKMMGPFGGCYALHSDCFTLVPHNFLVDDFYIAMHVLENNKNVINDLDAICKESVSHEISEEYRRKARISAGNFQNLAVYKHLLFPHQKSLAFTFLSHKVLRWLGPFFIILSYISNVFLAVDGNLFYSILLIFQTILIFFIPILDLFLQKIEIHISILRSVRYFFTMNLALLEGFVNYIKGIKSNVWEPTKRTS